MSSNSLTPLPVFQLPQLVSEPTQFYAGTTPMNSQAIELANLAAWHELRIGNTGLLSAPPDTLTLSPPGSAANPMATQHRSWVEEPPGSIPFDEQNVLALPPAQGPGVDATILTFTVPSGFDGIVRWISNNVVNNSAPYVPGALVWKILINGRPARNFGMITVEKGTVAQGRQISPLHLFSGDVVAYTVQEVLGGTDGQTVASLTGYFYPSRGIS